MFMLTVVVASAAWAACNRAPYLSRRPFIEGSHASCFCKSLRTDIVTPSWLPSWLRILWPSAARGSTLISFDKLFAIVSSIAIWLFIGFTSSLELSLFQYNSVLIWIWLHRSVYTSTVLPILYCTFHFIIVIISSRSLKNYCIYRVS